MDIAVTGIGVLSPLGQGVTSFLEGLRFGRSAIAELPDSVGGGIGAAFNPPFESAIDRSAAALMDPVSAYAITAAREAWLQSQPDALDPSRVGVVFGVGIGGIVTQDASYSRLYGEKRKVNALTIPKVMPSAAASQVSMLLGLRGPAFVVSSACASGAHAIMAGIQWLETRAVDAMVVGGAEAPFAFGLVQAWKAMHILAPDTCRPFSIERKGLVVGEGAGAMVLERLEDATARGVPIVALIRGFGATADAAHIVHPSTETVAKAMAIALDSAGVEPRQIDYVNAHGTGTRANDHTEAMAIRQVFGETPPVVSSIKGATGHGLGAAGAIEAVATIGALREGWLPPTLNYLGDDPDIGIDVCPNLARVMDMQFALSNSFAFGGLNASLVFEKP
jgi:nodulation protein E